MVHKTINPNYYQEIVTGKFIPSRINHGYLSETFFNHANGQYEITDIYEGGEVKSSSYLADYIKEHSGKFDSKMHGEFDSFSEYLDFIFIPIEEYKKSRYVNRAR